MATAFRLSTLLKLREATRDERRRALAEAFRAESMLGEALRLVGEEFAELAADYREATRPGRLNVDRLLECQRRESLLVAQRNEYARQRELLLGEIERRREALTLADREVKTLEKLRERQALAEAKRSSRRESKQLDEFALQAVARREETTWDA
ncbi:MAG: flagellar export protein FliJ [Planctomycetota bacterium]|nr:MAG: flagellar export protein FliJ [Planctomycetota bacterium]